MAHSYVCSFFHCVWSTKQRRNVIAPQVRVRLWAYLGGIARENGMKALSVGGTDNHVHVLLSLPSTFPVSKAVQLVKGGSSKWMSETFRDQCDFQWQEGYGAFSVGASRLRGISTYIENQLDHHRTQTFEDEFVAFLDRHGISYDAAHVFG